MTAYEKLQFEQGRLYDQLERYELSGDTRAAQTCLAQLVACEVAMAKLDASESAEATQPVAQPAVTVKEKPTAERLRKSVERMAAPVEQLPLVATVPVIENSKETKMAEKVTLESIGVDAAVAGSPVTKAQIGVAKFVRPFAGQAMLLTEKGELSFNGYPVAFPVEDSDILLLQAPTSKLTKEFRVHLEQREDVKRAARGLALFLGGAVQTDGSVSNGAGGRYQVIDGQCYKISEFKQTNGDGTKTTVRQPEACKGLVDPKTNLPTMRCKHQWALEFASGTFVTCSRKFFALVIQAEMASVIGDDAAAEFAKKTFETWKENGETRQLGRIAVAQAINDARNTGNVDANGLIHSAPAVLELAIGGKTLKDLIVGTSGKMFSVGFDVAVPVGEGFKVVPMRTRMCRNVEDFTSAVAPIYAAAKRGGKELVATSFTA